MNICVAIMDDEKIFCDDLSERLKNWGKDTKNSVDISVFNKSEDFISAWEKQKDFDIIFLDIKMGENSLSGMEVAHHIRNNGSNSPIVFLTSILDYMSEGYRVEAFRYLLKPLNEADFLECMDNVYLKVQKRGNKYLFLKMSDQKYLRIPYEDILFIEGARNYVDITTKQDTYHYRITLSELQKLLPAQFVKCHRSIIINIENVDGVERDGVIFGEKKQYISERYRGEIQKCYMQYFG